MQESVVDQGVFELYISVERFIQKLEHNSEGVRLVLATADIPSSAEKLTGKAKDLGKTIQQYGVTLARQAVLDCIKELKAILDASKKASLRDERLLEMLVVEASILKSSLELDLRTIDKPNKFMEKEGHPYLFPRDWGLPGVENLSATEVKGYRFFRGTALINCHRILRRAECDHAIQFKRLYKLLELAAQRCGQVSPNQERNRWLYELARGGFTWREIVAALNTRFMEEKPKWEPLESVNGVKAAVEKHQSENPWLEKVKSRQPGRPRKGTEIAEE